MPAHKDGTDFSRAGNNLGDSYRTIDLIEGILLQVFGDVKQAGTDLFLLVARCFSPIPPRSHSGNEEILTHRYEFIIYSKLLAFSLFRRSLHI